MREKSFVCLNCKKEVNIKAIGTKNRNHCSCCLWSLHVDEKISGDRKSNCHGLMEPVGLTFKDEGVDKYGKKRTGEIMVIHRCVLCGKVSKNRIAGDDNPKTILELSEEKDKEEVRKQLFGVT
jgi:DNA-directed RNA polymerase subunit RPC12/RpoP